MTTSLSFPESDRGNTLIDSVADSLVNQALVDTPIEEILEKTCMQLHAAGIPIARAQIGFKVLHPLFDAQTLTWKLNQKVERNDFIYSENRDPWRKSPMFYLVVNQISHMRRKLTGEEAILDFEILEALKTDGYTDYLAFLVPFSEKTVINKNAEELENSGIVGSWSTSRKTGFSEKDIQALKRIEQRLAVAFKINIQTQITENILSAYLGPDAGSQVLNGNIQRGDGETIYAVLWYSDMRDSTSLANDMSGKEFLQALNTYFESTAGAVLNHGGEVLRFIGDAVLAIFPIRDEGATPRACKSAMKAALEARTNMEEANQKRQDDNRPALDFGLGLHIGKVLFGNIGVPERVEFSVIGRAANEVARIESLTKELDRPTLVSSDFARNISGDWVDAGEHLLKGLDRPLQVYGPSDST
jgi:adenylate cyclase